MLLRFLLLIPLAWMSIGFAPSAHAHKFAISTGLYSLATTNQETGESLGSIGVGAYQFQYSVRILPRVTAEVGYFLIFSSGLAGLDSNGLETGLSFYPMGEPEAQTFRDDFVSLRVSEIWRPYVGAFFAQRQVVSAPFAGFGFKAGTEWVFKSPWLLKVEGRYARHSNPEVSPLSEITGNIGIGIEF